MARITLCLLLILQTLGAYAQSKPKLLESWQQKFFNSSDVVLPILIAAAVKYSAQLENLDAAKEIALDNQKIERRRILNGVVAGSSYSYGSVYNFADATGTRPIGSVNPFNLPTQSFYNVGAQAGISLATLLNRRVEFHRHQMLIKQAEANRKLGEREIRRAVISLYQEVVLSKAEQDISQEAYQAANLRFKLAEKQFANHEIQVGEMATVQEIHVRARIAQETSRVKYETAFLLLEELIGMSVIDLMDSK